MPKKELMVERSSREVIEHKLLVALEEGSGQVAIICNRQDLDLLIEGLSWMVLGLKKDKPSKQLIDRILDHRADLERLREEAFGA